MNNNEHHVTYLFLDGRNKTTFNKITDFLSIKSRMVFKNKFNTTKSGSTRLDFG